MNSLFIKLKEIFTFVNINLICTGKLLGNGQAITEMIKINVKTLRQTALSTLKVYNITDIYLFTNSLFDWFINALTFNDRPNKLMKPSASL